MSDLVIDNQIFCPTPNFRYDYRYLLNYKDITNSAYGFTSDETRLIQSTNYAQTITCTCEVGFFNTYNESVGVLPAMTTNLI